MLSRMRLQILTAAGLYPSPPNSPLNPLIEFSCSMQGCRVYRVAFESRPGFFVTGNLYEPAALESPCFSKGAIVQSPAILCPHGHWPGGRLEQSEDCSGPARCVGLARLGYIAFSWDMVGFCDSVQLPHGFGTETDASWGITPLGVQLWNSIRALDFLTELPGVNSEKIGITGESGGGTQTFLLCAVDDRIAVQAPVNMVSESFHGGCKCENAPGLRLGIDNVDIVASAAPRPTLLVSATGDWTKDTPSVEYPRVLEKYRLAGYPERVAWYQADARHNYNRESREAVYAWFATWFGLGPCGSCDRVDVSWPVGSPVKSSVGKLLRRIPEGETEYVDPDLLKVRLALSLSEDSDDLIRAMREERMQTSRAHLEHIVRLSDGGDKTAAQEHMSAIELMCGIPGDWRDRYEIELDNSCSQDKGNILIRCEWSGSNIELRRWGLPDGTTRESSPCIRIYSWKSHDNASMRKEADEVWELCRVGERNTIGLRVGVAEEFWDTFYPTPCASLVSDIAVAIYALGKINGSKVALSSSGSSSLPAVIARALTADSLFASAFDLRSYSAYRSQTNLPSFYSIGGLEACLVTAAVLTDGASTAVCVVGQNENELLSSNIRLPSLTIIIRGDGADENNAEKCLENLILALREHDVDANGNQCESQNRP